MGKLPQSFFLVEVGPPNNNCAAFVGRFNDYVFAFFRLFSKSVVSLVFASAVLVLFNSFTTEPGYATNCKFVSISCSFVIILVVVCISYLFSVESHLHINTSLHLNICLFGSEIKRAFMLWRKTCGS